MNDSSKATLMRVILALCICASIILMYKVFMIEKEFDVVYKDDLSNPIPE